jgi:amino acid adenylation domain-containing protein
MSDVVDTYELSPMQQGMLFHALSEHPTGVDIEQIIITLRESLDLAAFESSWRNVVARYPILRTRFRWEDVGEPCQEVLAGTKLAASVSDWSDLPPDTAEQRFCAHLRADRRREFDLSTAPMMRLFVALLPGGESRVLWTFHHALLDGRSFALVLSDVFALYDAAKRGEAALLPPARPFRDYIAWRRSLDLSVDEAFWRNALGTFHTPTPLTVGAPPSPATPDEPFGSHQQRLPGELSEQLRRAARHADVTVNTMLQAAWAVLLHRYSGESDVVFGATRAGRSTGFAEANEMVGLFINTLPMRISLDDNAEVVPWLKSLRSQQIALRPYEHTPLAAVQACSAVERGAPLFESAIVYDHQTLDVRMQMPGRHFEYIGQTNFPLVLIAYGDDEVLLRLEYSTSRFSAAAMERMLKHLVSLLAQLAGEEATYLGDLDPVGASERAELVGVGPVECFSVADVSLGAGFARQVAATPGAVAVSADTEAGRVELTYRELDERAEQLAAHLLALGVTPGEVVGLRVHRGPEVVIGMLAILKAGAAYLPLDPVYPSDRIAFMLDDAAAQVVLTHSTLAGPLSELPVTCVCLDEPIPLTSAAPAAPLTPTGEDLAYVIYTSGSTGKPKGVRVTHHNVLRLFAATDAWYNFGPHDVWTLFHSYAFDFSVWEIWGALLYGGRVVVVPQAISRDPSAFRALLQREHVTVLSQTPTAFRALIDADQTAPPAQYALRYIVFGGEALQLHTLKPWFDRYGDHTPQLINMYGITETTVHVTYRPITKADLTTTAGSLIGIPIPDLRIYLLDQHARPVPAGVAGEMYVAGAGVADGYLNRDELTAQRFLPDPFHDGTMYRTGDLARRLPNGELEYLGRIDQQVKIRGFRIELGEIEAAIATHPAINDVAVIDREDTPGEKKLIAYLVTHTPPTPTLTTELRTALHTHLPDYMIPAHFHHLPALPLTPNGKLDRKALPTPQPTQTESGRPYIAPRSTSEALVVEVFSEVLDRSDIGVFDNFFELGGQSLMAARVMSKLRKTTSVDMPLRNLFERPTPEQLAKAIDALSWAAGGTASAVFDGQGEREEIEL